MSVKVFNEFVKQIQDEGINLKYAQLRQGGDVIAEYSAMPTKTRLNSFSLCKSVVGLAAGYALQEGLISLDEKVCDIFPEYVEPTTSANLLKCTFRHLLTMTSGLDTTLFFCDWPERYYIRDWIQYYFNVNFPHEPGTVFVYSNFNTYMATCCIERRAGENLLEFLRHRFFEPIGIENPDWTLCPNGHVVSANGLHMTIDEMGFFGEFVLRRGNWQGQQLLNKEYVDEATSAIVDTGKYIKQLEGAGFSPKVFCHGYGYQFWKTPVPGTTLSSGNYGQHCFIIPQSDAVFCYQAMAGFKLLRLMELGGETVANM
ncbi:MAG: beta-lactamase family protein [Christensenellaceae bacterium]|jgi:CubicO group peptidase (beta-lactamase class C family)|nr:beta-lactamase family protein [Christensenellaceae bacterium]